MAIELQSNQSADPDRCGSCKYFRRTRDGESEFPCSTGLCIIVLPSWVQPAKQEVPREVRDTMRCDLYKPSGQEFQRTRVWRGGEKE